MTARPPAADAERIQAISDWLIHRGLQQVPLPTLVSELCERLRASGVPVARATVATRTLHPSIDAVSARWFHGRESRMETIGFDDRNEPGWLNSPFRFLVERRERMMRRRLLGANAERDFPLLDELAAERLTDYVVFLLPFEDGEDRPIERGVIASWASDAPAGFSDKDIATIDRLMPRLALAVLARLTRDISTNLLDTYLGRAVGRRVLKGEIRRGEMDVIHAALLYADLRDFTAATDVMAREDIVPMLDAYFECVVPPVLAHDGEVLKYLGDGLLATFDLARRDKDAVCHDALAAAHEALARVAALNEQRRAAGKIALELDLALHLGEVLYGNVGAADRLDFTVIGPAVNEASRIELLCAELGHNLVLSETFAAAAQACAPGLVPLGRHRLRGVREPQALFTHDTTLMGGGA